MKIIVSKNLYTTVLAQFIGTMAEGAVYGQQVADLIGKKTMSEEEVHAKQENLFAKLPHFNTLKSFSKAAFAVEVAETEVSVELNDEFISDLTGAYFNGVKAFMPKIPNVVKTLLELKNTAESYQNSIEAVGEKWMALECKDTVDETVAEQQSVDASKPQSHTITKQDVEAKHH